MRVGCCPNCLTNGVPINDQGLYLPHLSAWNDKECAGSFGEAPKERKATVSIGVCSHCQGRFELDETGGIPEHIDSFGKECEGIWSERNSVVSPPKKPGIFGTFGDLLRNAKPLKKKKLGA